MDLLTSIVLILGSMSLGAYTEKHFGWWSWIEDNILEKYLI